MDYLVFQLQAPLAAWGEPARLPDGALAYADPRLPALGQRVMLPPHLADEAIADLGAQRVDAADYEAHRIALGVPRGEVDFGYNDAFPHEADMDQLNGVDFRKGCFIGQRASSRLSWRKLMRFRRQSATFT